MSGCIDHGQGSRVAYANARYGGRQVGLHRLTYFKTHGTWPEVVRHTCDNKRCINPAHLLGGTQADNIQDKVTRNRQAKGTKHGKAVLSEADVKYIREAYVPRSKETGQCALARKFNVSQGTIGFIVRGETWS